MSVQKEVTVIKTENEYVKVGDTFIVEMNNHKGGEPKQKKPKTKLPSLRELIMQMQININNIQTEVKEMKQDFNNKIDNIQAEIKEMKKDFNEKINDINTKIDKIIKLNGLKTE
ncbi:MAG: CCDC90 family protein [Mycoplasmataceae bacterium]|jgi:gas vesicle protein|nr:CCDC90 family protein [Mycoplasmataceae bacterium]